MIALKVLSKLTRWLWLTVATVVISYAVIVALGRYMLPSLDNYRPQVAGQLSQLLGADVQVERLSGTWPRFAPTLSADHVTIAAPDSGGDIEIGQVSAELDPFASLWRGQLIWRQLNLSRVIVQLTEDSRGMWSVAGFPLGRGGQGVKPIEILLYSSLIQVDRVELRMNFYSGATLGLKAEDILVENSGDFHRILANLTSGEEQLARFVFEATGDYSDPDNFDGAAYLQLKHLNLASFESIFGRLMPPAYAEKIRALDGGVETRLWFDMEADGRTNVVGRLSAGQLPLDSTVGVAEITDLKTDLVGWYQPGEDWGVALQELQFQWGGEPVPPLNIQFRQQVGDRWGEFSVGLTRLNIAALSQLALNSQLLPEKLQQVIAGLSPVGRAEQVSFNVSLSQQGPPSMVLRANLHNAGINGYRGVPAATGVDGYLETTIHNGVFVLDARDTAVHFDKLFERPVVSQHASGTLSWSWDRQLNEVSLVSSPLQVTAEAGQIRGQFYLQLPIRSKRPDDPPQLFLQMGVRNSHSRYREQFIPTTLNPKLLDWLDSAIADTEIQQAGVMFRGSIRKGQRSRRTLHFYVKANGERLQYHPQWPALENYAGELLYRSGKLQGHIDRGALGGVQVSGGTIDMDALGDQVLAVKASGTAKAPQALALLNRSPLREPVAGLADWQLSGKLSTTADLRIPLKGDWRSGRYRVTTRVENASMAQPQYQVDIDSINGTLNYSLDKGIYAEQLSANLWNLPMTASLATVDDKLQFDMQGKLQVAALADHFGWSPGELISGESDIRARVVLTGRDSGETSRITLDSDLQGIAVQLPSPFAKDAQQKRSLQATLTLADKAIVEAQYGREVRAGAELVGQQLRRGYLGVNRSDLMLPEKPELLLAADVSAIDLADWQSRLLQHFDRDSGQATGWLPPTRFDVRVGELGVSALTLPKAHLAGTLTDSVLRTRLESPSASGLLDIPLDNRKAMTIALEHLDLPQWQAGSETGASEFDPRSLRDMRVSIQQLSLQKQPLGRAAFSLQTNPDGLVIRDVDAELLGLTVGGGEQGGATLAWRFDGAEHSSHFDGSIQAGNIAKVLENFGLEAVIKSEQAVFQSNLQWRGRPWQLSRENLDGQLAFTLHKGNLYQSTGGAANAFMRVVGLFNFSTWVRRLRLDFSDVFRKGISYDNISGSLIFQRGTLHFPEPIVAKAPSGTMQMRGSVDLLEEQVDAQLIATLPVGTNLPWVAALAVNLPAAAGAWVISKIFKKQVNKLSSISYKIDGSLEDPDINIEKIFAD